MVKIDSVCKMNKCFWMNANRQEKKERIPDELLKT